MSKRRPEATLDLAGSGSPGPSAAAGRDAECAVELQDIFKNYRGKSVLAGATLRIKRGEVMVILGPSGTGKSVTLRHINGLTKPDSGRVFIFGEDITPLSEEELRAPRMRMGMLFQGGALFDSLNVGDNVAFPLQEHSAKPPEEIRRIVAEKLSLVGLPGIERRMPAELSGGMKKRVALARAIALEPDIILYDEPTTGLDPITAEKINELIEDVNRRLKTTSVVVTHDIVSARAVADRVAFLHNGSFEFVGTFEEAAAGAHPMLTEFFRSQGFPCGTHTAALAAREERDAARGRMERDANRGD
jgi:phospholipid/cholesterol/gamma-HCH transport system ATP-binding protein